MVHHYSRIITTLLLGLTLLTGLIAIPVSADNPEVNITVSAFIVGTPGGLTLTYVSDYEVGISWTPGEGSENTMVRAAVGRVPENRTDGYLVYYGDGISTSDFSNNLEVMDAKIYYRAWSENAGGEWEEEGITNWLAGGGGMTLMFFAIICLGLMVSGFKFKAIALMIAAGLAWVGLGVYGYNSASIGLTAGMDHLLLGLGLVMAFVCFVVPITWTMTKRKEALAKYKKNYKSVGDTYLDELRQIQRDARRGRY